MRQDFDVTGKTGLRENDAAGRWHVFHVKNKVFCKPFNILPLIDISLIFMLFILASARFIMQPGINVELPAREFVSGAMYGNLVVTLTQEGMVFFNDERMPLEGLKSGFAQSVHKRNDSALTIEADARVPYGVVVKVMNIATEAGIKEVNLAAGPALEQDAD